VGEHILQKLMFLDVSHSYHLMRTPDFPEITNLEVSVLNNCTSLVKVHNSVVHLDKLVTLDLADCKNLTKIPSGIYKLKSDFVNLSGCTKLVKGLTDCASLVENHEAITNTFLMNLPGVYGLQVDSNAFARMRQPELWKGPKVANESICFHIISGLDLLNSYRY
jgi:hypothetical protein